MTKECDHIWEGKKYVVCKKCGERAQFSRLKEKTREFQDMAAAYIELAGGKILVVGSIEIRHRGPEKCNYELVIPFTGSVPRQQGSK